MRCRQLKAKLIRCQSQHLILMFSLTIAHAVQQWKFAKDVTTESTGRPLIYMPAKTPTAAMFSFCVDTNLIQRGIDFQRQYVNCACA